MTCNQCSGIIDFPEESEGATVPCPHCGKYIFLYRMTSTGGTSPKTHQYASSAKHPEKSIARIVEGIASILVGAMIVFFIIFYVVSGGRSKATPKPQPVQTAQVAPPQPPAIIEARPTRAYTPPARTWNDWNTTDINALQNGNIGLAIDYVKTYNYMKNSAGMITPQPELVERNPAAYYGKVLKLTGTVGYVQDYPAGDGNSIGGKDTKDIVIVCADGTIAEILCMKYYFTPDNLVVGDVANIYGFPAGVTEVPNQNGGHDTPLVLIGDDYDDLGTAH
jgi:DNA-directed RNA polymerase subunit RPC12/RpoP